MTFISYNVTARRGLKDHLTHSLHFIDEETHIREVKWLVQGQRYCLSLPLYPVNKFSWFYEFIVAFKSFFAGDHEILFDLAFSWPCHEACKILVPLPGIELVPLALEAQSLNHWTAREIQNIVWTWFSSDSSSHKCLLKRVSKPQFLRFKACLIIFMQQRGVGRGRRCPRLHTEQGNPGDRGQPFCGLVERQGSPFDSVNDT